MTVKAKRKEKGTRGRAKGKRGRQRPKTGGSKKKSKKILLAICLVGRWNGFEFCEC